MKKLIIFFAACNFALTIGCSTKKQPGEEYYDPDYKPQANQSATPGAATDNTTTAAAELNTTASTGEATATGGAAVGTEGATGGAGAASETGTAAATGSVATTDPAKDEPTVNVVKKDVLKPSPAGGNFDKGKNLIAKSDCLACHKDDAKLLGPAYVDVAKKYEPTAKNIDYLANKIIKGGAGVWGDIPMSPHPTLPSGDAKEMVKYILSLNK